MRVTFAPGVPPKLHTSSVSAQKLTWLKLTSVCKGKIVPYHIHSPFRSSPQGTFSSSQAAFRSLNANRARTESQPIF